MASSSASSAGGAAPDRETASWQGFNFWRTPSHAVRPPRANLVSTVVFRVRAGYRESAIYATLLARLCTAVRTHLPTFTLRVYCDASVDPDNLRRMIAEGTLVDLEGKPLDGASGEALVGAWATCHRTLLDSGCAEVVWFEHPQFLDAGAGGAHKGMFGTLVRFLPLFDIPPEDTGSGALPPWCGCPVTLERGNPATVFVCDADYHDRPDEHISLQFAKWYSQAKREPGTTATSLVPELACVTYGAPPLGSSSSVLRHSPTRGMPAIMAGIFAARTRFPYEWLTDLFVDLRRDGHQVLLGRFCEGIYDSARRDKDFESHKMEHQRPFPYGCDEFMLTCVLKNRGGCRPAAAPWMFLIIPNVAGLVKNAVSIAQRVVTDSAGGGGATSTPRALAMVQRIGTAAAACAALPPPTCPPSQYGGGKEYATRWSEITTNRYGLHFRVFTPGAIPKGLAPDPQGRLASELIELCSAAVDAMAAGVVEHTGEELEHFGTALEIHSSLFPRAIAPLTFSVGGGRWESHGGGGAQAEALLHFLAEALMQQPGSRLPNPKRPLDAVGEQGAAPIDKQRRSEGGEPSGAGSSHVTAGANASGAWGGGAGSGSSSDGAGAARPAPQPGVFPAWELRQSRSTQKWYYTQGEESVWFDPELPRAWAWGRVGGKDSAPKYYVNLETGERMENRPE